MNDNRNKTVSFLRILGKTTGHVVLSIATIFALGAVASVFGMLVLWDLVFVGPAKLFGPQHFTAGLFGPYPNDFEGMALTLIFYSATAFGVSCMIYAFRLKIWRK